MNKPAVSLALAGTLSLAALAGCGSSSASPSPSTSVTSTTTTPSASDITSPSESASAGVGASATASDTTSTTTSSSASASTSGTGPTASGTLEGTTQTLHKWSVSAPKGWSRAATNDSDGGSLTWTSPRVANVTLRLLDGQMQAGEAFTDDLKSMIDGFDGKPESNTAVTVKGATEAREARGYGVLRTSGSTGRRYVDMIMAHEGNEIVVYSADAPTKAALEAAGVQKYLPTLAHS